MSRETRQSRIEQQPAAPSEVMGTGVRKTGHLSKFDQARMSHGPNLRKPAASEENSNK